MKREPLQVVVTSGGERIGTLTPAEFSAAHPAPHGTFLPDNVEAFNAWKKRLCEPERVHLELIQPTQRRRGK